MANSILKRKVQELREAEREGRIRDSHRITREIIDHYDSKIGALLAMQVVTKKYKTPQLGIEAVGKIVDSALSDI